MNGNVHSQRVNDTADAHHASMPRHLAVKLKFTTVNLDIADRPVDRHHTELETIMLNSGINILSVNSVAHHCRADRHVC